MSLPIRALTVFRSHLAPQVFGRYRRRSTTSIGVFSALRPIAGFVLKHPREVRHS